MPHLWTIELLGGLSAVRQGERTTRFATLKTGSLLAYLAYYRKKPHLRDTLADMLWPDVDPAQGRSRLSTLLSYVRNLLEPPGVTAGSMLIADRSTVRLSADLITTDVALWEETLAQAAKSSDLGTQIALLHRARALYGGDLLPGFYEEWIAHEQARLREKRSDMLHALAAGLNRSGEPAAAAGVLDEAVAADPYREPLVRLQMRCLAAIGRQDAALESFRRLESRLRDDLDAPPAAATRALAEEIRQNPDAVAASEVEPPIALASAAPPAVPQRATDARMFQTQSVPEAPQTASLPLQLTRFVGRERELADLTAMLADPFQRLLTLTGPGGSGKTRLAIEASAHASGAFAGRVWFVDLSRITHPRLFSLALAQALAVAVSTTADPWEQCLRRLSEARSLLVLDNFEHLLRDEGDAARSEGGAIGTGSIGLVRLLLERSPSLTCLVTSRQPLRIGGEQEYPVAVLPVPDSDAGPAALIECESVALYMDRARAVRPDFALTSHNARSVAALCRTLEGMPLAIEMAAAWSKMLTPARMVERIGSQMDLLVSRRRDLPARHQSMRAAIEWSYDLLDPGLRRLFANLSVFRGGWTTEQAEQVCALPDGDAGGGTDPGDRAACSPPVHDMPDALLGLSLLQERSLIVADVGVDETRFRFLAVLREFAAEKLEQEGAADVLRGRHLTLFLRVATESVPHLTGPEQAARLTRLEREHDNFRAALEFCAGSPAQVEEGLLLVGALSRFWVMRGYMREGLDWVERLLAHPEAQAPTHARAEALVAAGNLSVMRGDLAGSEKPYAECIAIVEGGPHLRLFAQAAIGLGKAAQEQGRFDAAVRHYETVLARCTESEFPTLIAVALNNLGGIAARQADYAKARGYYERSLALRRAHGDIWGIANTLRNLGYTAQAENDPRAACAYHTEALRLSRELDNPTGIGYTLHGLATAMLDVGDLADALAATREGLEIKLRLGDRQGLVLLVEAMARCKMMAGEHATAASLYALVERTRAEVGYPRTPKEEARLAAETCQVRAALGDAEYARIASAPNPRTLEEVVASLLDAGS